MNKINKKYITLALIGLAVTSLILSYISFQRIGSVYPDYGIPRGNRFIPCNSLSLYGGNLKQIYYSKGFPFPITGTTEIDIDCELSSLKSPNDMQIRSSWQLYVNAIIYGILGFGMFKFIVLKLGRSGHLRH